MSVHSLIVVAHNIRSAHNVGSIFRSCEGFGVERLILSGYSPYPDLTPSGIADSRLPHLRAKISAQIHKTALGAENFVPFVYTPEVDFAALHRDGYRVVGLEQAVDATLLPAYAPPKQIALLLGEEVAGIDPHLLSQCDDILEIPMYGRKESFNVSVACGIALYQLRVS